MRIYNKMKYYSLTQNETAEKFSKRIIVEKFPGSLAHIIILTKK